MGIRILFIGEIVGKAGVFCIKSLLPRLKAERSVDFVIANGDGVTGGFGIGKNHSIYLHKLGIDVITSGECIYYKKDMVPHIEKAPYILRAANYPPGAPGRGWRIYRRDSFSIAVVCMMGQSGFNRVHPSNPYTFLPDIVSRIREQTRAIIVDFHASTTAEKYTMFHHADGMVSAVVGTHTKALTADAQVMPGGTAVICDAGRTGSIQSVGGLDPEVEIQKYVTMIPERSRDAWAGPELQGVLIEIDDAGKAVAIETIREKCQEVPHDREGNDNEDRESADNGESP